LKEAFPLGNQVEYYTAEDQCLQGIARQEAEKGEGLGKKIKWRLSEVNTRAMSRGQDELIGKFKMVAGDVISIRGQVLEYTYIPTEIERELVKFGMDGDRKG
jgi:hypothetical protein